MDGFINIVSKFWGIRHIRWYIKSRLLILHVMRWQKFGCLHANKSDEEYLKDIWDGKR